MGRRLRRVLTVVVLAVVLCLVVATSYVALVAWRSHRVVTLPAPGGRFAVGRVEDTGTDASRDRELAVWTWYPAVAGTGAPATYAPGAWSGLGIGLPVGETGMDRVRDPALEAATPAPGRFPVVVLSPGLGFAAPQYAALAEDLASRGYVVVGVTPTGSANLTVILGDTVGPTDEGNPSDFSGGHTEHDEAVAARLLPTWVADARFAAATAGRLDRSRILGGHVDPADVSYVGHSFGGTASLEACHEDPRCAAAVDLDGTIYGEVGSTGLAVPSLLVGHDGSCVTGECTPDGAADRAAVEAARRYRSASAGQVRSATVDGIGHLAFSDDGLLYWAWPLRAYLGLDDRAGPEPLRETADLVTEVLPVRGASAAA